MKLVVPSLLLLPLLTSCVVQEGYYAPGYYSAPSPPYVEIHRHDEYRHAHRHHQDRRHVPQVRVYPGRGNPNVHGHDNRQPGQAVIVNPRQPQVVKRPADANHTNNVEQHQ
jgi:hypothetical protein